MKGIRVFEAVLDSLPKNNSTFAIFFEPIFPTLKKYHWLYLEQPFSYDEDKTGDCGRAIQGIPANDGYIAPNTLLPKYSRFVCGNWNNLFGFESMPDAPLMFSRLMTRDGVFFEKAIDLCFFNVDAAYWDFYAKEEELLRVVTKHASSLAGVQVEQVEFSDFEF